MESEPTSPGGPEVRLPVMVAAEVQDSLLVVMHDLHRLEGLISHATDNLLERFGVANQNLTESSVGDSPELQAAREALRAAVTELQFQDMASQLIAHTHRRLRNCADRLARDVMGDDEDGEAVVEEAPLRPNPVTQDEMDAGSIELF